MSEQGKQRRHDDNRLRPHEIAREIAHDVLRRGWRPVAIPARRKSPKDPDWQLQEITVDNVNEKFRRWHGNVGVQFGKVSGGLTDVDLDCYEAIELAKAFLPKTNAVFGRRSKRQSHWFYITDLGTLEEKAVIRWVEPKSLARDPDKPATLVELRIGGGNKGAQTLFPGSVHPSGERVEWDSDGDPAQVDGARLKRIVGALAAGSLLARNYPHQGARHDAALVVGGVLARMPDMEATDIEAFVTAIACAAGDNEANERGRSAAGAVDLLKRNEPTPGLPRMREVWGKELTDTVAKWLDIGHKFDDVEDSLIDELAQLDMLEYDRRRNVVANELGGIRVSTLDKIVEARRAELASKEVRAGFLKPVDPWPEKVSGDKLLNDLCTTLNLHIVLSNGLDLAIALWILHAHGHDAARHSPILYINSPTKRCGKTNLLELMTRLVPKPLSAANVTPATIFRAIDRWHPTMLIDEMDTFLSDKSELRGVLNSGHTRSQAYVLRCVGDDLIPTQFSTWSPKAFASIGRMHPTLEDRSIPIALKRKLTTEKVSRIPKTDDAYSNLLRQCARWAEDHMEKLRAADPKLPALNDRARDNWAPLLAIADACGEDWGAEARQVAIRLSSVDDDETHGIQLLEDLRILFERHRCDETGKALSSTRIVEELHVMEDRPWPEFKNGHAITTRGVATLLKPWKIYPRQIKVDGRWGPNGYYPKQFEAAFKRYLTHKSSEVPKK